LGALGARETHAAITAPVRAAPRLPPVPVPPLAAARVEPGRIVKITVGLRPFRPAGPNHTIERVGRQTVVHAYGHGGSGWSLSWGVAGWVAEEALRTGAREIAVLGCGAIGLTTARVLQRAGARVTIYAKDRPPAVTSSVATGVWSPDSRFCLAEQLTPRLAQQWEAMSRASYHQFQHLLGLPGAPVEWCDRYALSDVPFAEAQRERDAREEPKMAKLQERLKGLVPPGEELPRKGHPFAVRHVRRSTSMVFNLTAYAKLLVDDFVAEGGRIVRRELRAVGELAELPEPTLVNATGLGARELFGDTTLVPVRGQLAVLVPQPEVNYGLNYRDVSLVPRRDGLVVQLRNDADYGRDDLTADRAEADAALAVLAGVYATMRAG
jgi:glycine/D-amino acid oxidase-like deaminating enzyme